VLSSAGKAAFLKVREGWLADLANVSTGSHASAG
jgi:hypothetical protein